MEASCANNCKTTEPLSWWLRDLKMQSYDANLYSIIIYYKSCEYLSLRNSITLLTPFIPLTFTSHEAVAFTYVIKLWLVWILNLADKD